MLSRALAVSAAVAAMTIATSVAATGAGSAPPPPPTSTNGNPVHLVASGLKTPTSFAFGGGSIFEGDGGNSEGSQPPNGGIYVLKDGAGTRIPGSPKFVAGLAWHKGALYSSGGYLTKTGVKWRLSKWMGWNGTAFKSHKAIYTAPQKFQGFNGIGFGANGRLYVGVDVGLLNNNDHGPRDTSPYVYDILSLQPNGKDLKVFATGMRQPWQMVFPTGSSSPFVTDLGQDGGAKNPPDFVLRVKAGQDYGFPKCNHTTAGKCAGFAKPLRKFGPHTDLMGIGLKGHKLYLSSFLGRQGQGPGGEVFWMPRSGGKLTPLLKGFVAPTVGLGIHGNHLFVGELTGQVFRVKI